MRNLSIEEMEFVHLAIQELDNQDEVIQHFEEDLANGLINTRF